MLEIWAWFIGTKIGRFVLASFGVITAFFAVYLKGKQDQKTKDELKKLEDVSTARKIENEVDALSDDDLQQRASKWVRK